MDGSGVFRHHCKSGLGAIFHDARQWRRPPAWQKHGARTRAAGRIVNCAVFVPAGGLEARLYPTNGPTCKRALIHLYITHVAVAEPCRAVARPAASRPGAVGLGNEIRQKAPSGAFFLPCPVAAHIQYTRMYSPSQTTSTKCQYQAAPSKPKWRSAVKCPFCNRRVMKNNISMPTSTWKP